VSLVFAHWLDGSRNGETVSFATVNKEEWRDVQTLEGLRRLNKISGAVILQY